MLIVGLLCLYPLGVMVELSFRPHYPGAYDFTLSRYAAALNSGYIVRQLLTTLSLAAVVTAACAVVGYPVAYYIARDGSRFRNLVVLGLTLPLLVNIVVRTIGWTILLGSEGVINRMLVWSHAVTEPVALMTSFWPVAVGLVHVMLPFMVISIAGVLQKIDVSVEDTARLHGAGPLKTFFHVTLPLTAHGLAAGATLVFCLTVGAYVTPYWLSRGMLPTLSRGIYEQAVVLADLPGAAATSMLLIVACAIAVTAFAALARRYGAKGRGAGLQ